MTGGRDIARANAVAVHFLPEPFTTVADAELAAHPLVLPGVCLNPSCSRQFRPTREWQVYCSAGCREAGVREFRNIGHQAAPALLAWQMGRYAQPDTPLGDLSRAGRRYYSALASEWWRDRRARIARAGQEREGMA